MVYVPAMLGKGTSVIHYGAPVPPATEQTVATEKPRWVPMCGAPVELVDVPCPPPADLMLVDCPRCKKWATHQLAARRAGSLN